MIFILGLRKEQEIPDFMCTLLVGGLRKSTQVHRRTDVAPDLFSQLVLSYVKATPTSGATLYRVYEQ